MKYSIIISIFLSFLFVACGEKEAPPVVEAIRPVRYAKITKEGTGSSNTFSGTCQSSKEAKLSFKVAGSINKLNVQIGDKIRKGTLIATLDAIDYSIQSDQAKDQLKSAASQVKSAETQRIANKSNYERVEKLYENNSVPLSDYEKAKASYETAQSQYEASLSQLATTKKQVEASKNQVRYTKLYAPFSGVITTVNVEENELVNSGMPIAVLSADGKPELNIGIPEVYISQIKKGQKVDIHFSTIPGKTFKGRVSKVSFSSSEAATYPVILDIDQPTSDIRPGMAADATFSFGKQNEQQKLVAPAKAISEGPDGHFVFLVKKSGTNSTIKKTKVEVGVFMKNGFEIKSGLKEGDLVATAGLATLLDGIEVKLMEN